MRTNTTRFFKARHSEIVFTIVLAVCFVFTSKAQVKHNMSFGNSIIQTKEGGYALTGKTYPNGGDVEGVYVVNLDSTGNINWTKTISGKYDELGNTIIQTRDGGYALTGETYSSDFSGKDVYAVKLDATGNVKWTKSAGGMSDEFGSCIAECKDGCFIVTGATTSIGAFDENVYVVKFDSSGNIKWKRTISGQKYSHGSSIIQTKDGGFAIGEYVEVSSTPGGKSTLYNFAVVKLDTMGNTQWTKTLGGAGSKSPYYLIQTTDGGYAVTGTIDSSGISSEDIYVVKLDAPGNVQWTKIIGGSNKDIGAAIIQTTDGGYAITGATKSSGSGNFDVYVITLDAAGKTIWTKTIGGAGDDQGESIIQTADGGFAIGGFTNKYNTSDYQFYAIKLDTLGNTQWTKAIGGESH